MRIQYQLRFWDVVLFHAVHQFLNPVVQAFYLLLTLFIFYSERTDGGAALRAAMVAGAIYGVMWALQFIFNALYLISRRNRNVLTQHALELQQESVLEETEFTRTLVRWPGVGRVVSRPGFVALYISPHLAHLVPNRAFSSAAHRSEFVSFARERLRASSAGA